MSTGELAWNPPRWQRYPKHLPLPRETWQRVVRATRGEAARYHADLSVAQIERIEMDTVRQIVDGHLRIPGLGTEVSPPPRANERIFWRDLGFVIGASDGEETSLVYVIYNQTGTVHGYPISRRELLQLGIAP